MSSTTNISRRLVASLATAATISVAGFGIAPAFADNVTIPVIVKDTTSPYWQIVLAGATLRCRGSGAGTPRDR